MALKPFNSVGGFSIGDSNIVTIINANGNVTTSNLSVTAGFANLGNVGNIYIGGGGNGQVLITDGAGNLNWTDAPLDLYQIQNGNSNVTIPSANGNVFINAGASQWIFDTTGNLVGPGSGSANLGNRVTANYANFANDVVVQGNIANANNISVTNNITTNTANVTGNLSAGNISTGGSGGNITLSGGNISGANVVLANGFTSNGGLVDFKTANSNVQLGSNANVHLYGGNAGQVLQTDGAGNLNWVTTATSSSIFNGDSNVSIPTANGNINLTSAGNTTIVVTGTGANITGYANISGNVSANNANVTGNLTSGNANLGNLLTANYANFANDVVVQGNIANANNISVTNNITTNTANVTGNLSAGNANLGNLLTANYANFANDVVVQGNIANANNISVTYNIASNTANVTGNLTSGNANLGNLLTANYANFANDVVVQGNIANAGNISVTGNVTAQNFVGTLANGSSNVSIPTANGNIIFSPGTGYANTGVISPSGLTIIGNISANGTITSNTGIISNSVTAFANTVLTLSAGVATGNANVDVTLVPTGNGTVNVSSKRITNLATPTEATDAATKQYVDDVAQGLNVHDAANVATTGTLASLTGGTITYDNGTAGVGATLTLSGSPTKTFTDAGTFDGGFTAVATDRILVRAQTNAAHNGVYVVTNSTVLTRADDYNTVPEVEAGDFIFVIAGSTYEASGWVQTSIVTTIGTSPINFTQFSGAGAYSANTAAGLILNGTVFSAKVDGNINPTIAFDGSGNLYVPANAAFTTPNVGAAIGTSINLTGNVLAGNVNSNALITAANLDVSNNIVTGNITANTNANITGNLSANNANITTLLTAGNANITSTLTAGNVYANSGTIGANLLTGTLTTNAQPNITSVGTLSNLTIASNGNIAMSGVDSTLSGANLVSATFLTGTLTTNAQPNITSVGTLTSLAVTNNITAGNVYANSGTIGANLLTGTLTTAAQPNITSVGTLSNLEAAGNVNFTTASNVALGSNANVHITGGNAGQVLQTDGAGNLNWVTTATSSSIFNGNSNVAIPTANGNVNLTSAGNTTMVVTDTGANITGYANISGNVSANNATIGNIIALGNTKLNWATTTTTATSLSTIATVPTTGVTGIEFLIKGVDSTGAKYSTATVTAVTDGANVDYVVFATAFLNASPGSLEVNMSGSNIILQVTPSSVNSTVWTTQFRTV